VNAEKPPRVGLGLLKRGFVAAILIVLSTAGAVSAAGFLQTKEIVRIVEREGRAPIAIPEIDPTEAGKPQTLMILGSDQRWGEKKGESRSDTILLVRLDASQRAIALMSIPRDLKVTLPGQALPDKINAAYANGGPRATTKAVKSVFRQATGENFKINHVLNVNFGAFRRAVNRIGGVYVDVDRTYFNDNAPPRNSPSPYATIDVKAGYQKLKGRDALDFVRYRHEDNDLVRAARQQDFLRELRNSAGTRELLQWSNRKELAALFAHYVDTDAGLRKTKGIFRLLKLVLGTASKPVRQITFPISGEDEQYVMSSDTDLRRAAARFLEPPAAAPIKTTRKAKRKNAKKARVALDLTTAPNLVRERQTGENMAILAAKRLRRLPFYFPTLKWASGVYSQDSPRIYTIEDERGKRHRAYRIVVRKNLNGEYYGVQGTTWREPPILDGRSVSRTVKGRRLRLFYDGGRVRRIAWRTPRAVYWVSNTLAGSLSARQMIALASSLRVFGRSK